MRTEDSGPQNLPGTLLAGASLVKGGKSGKCLSLVGDDTFGTGTRLFPDGLAKFLEVMPVSPQGRLTTTWGEIKTRR